MKHKKNDYYLKVVEWSEEDGCYVGTAPGLIIGGIHGPKEAKVFTELCKAVDEAIQLLKKDGRFLPVSTAKKKYSGKILLRLPKDLHKTIALKALQEGESVNRFIQQELESHL